MLSIEVLPLNRSQQLGVQRGFSGSDPSEDEYAFVACVASSWRVRSLVRVLCFRLYIECVYHFERTTFGAKVVALVSDPCKLAWVAARWWAYVSFEVGADDASLDSHYVVGMACRTCEEREGTRGHNIQCVDIALGMLRKV